MDIDAAFERARIVLGEASKNLDAIRSEEDAKIQIITRIITEALGWQHSDISAEEHNENGFSDYRISDASRNAFLLEAKKIGVIEVGTTATRQGAYKISGPVLNKTILGIQQAASYCHPLGIQLAVLTDGCIWIVFLPWVAQASYKDKQAILFPGFEAIETDFALFYELLSKQECKKNTFRVIFDRIHENRLALERALVAPIAPGANYLVQKSALAFDLERVFSAFFANMTGDDDTDMMIECFVESRESIVADFSLERITRNVLGNIDPHKEGVEAGLREIVQGTVGGDIGQTVFIVGPSGAGKTTFLDRFFQNRFRRKSVRPVWS